jgi:DUF917 family protein
LKRLHTFVDVGGYGEGEEGDDRHNGANENISAKTKLHSANIDVVASIENGGNHCMIPFMQSSMKPWPGCRLTQQHGGA